MEYNQPSEIVKDVNFGDFAKKIEASAGPKVVKTFE